jgi:hypothetical protein
MPYTLPANTLAAGGGSLVVNADGSITATTAVAKQLNIDDGALIASQSAAYADIAFSRNSDMSEVSGGLVVSAGLWVNKYGTPTSNTGNTLEAIDVNVVSQGSHNFTGATVAVAGGNVHLGTGTVTNMYGMTMDMESTLSSPVTTRTAFVDFGDNKMAGTIGTQYSFYVGSVTKATTNVGLYVGNASPGWAVYVAGGNSRFEGQVGIQQGGVSGIALLGVGANVTFDGTGNVAEGINVQLTGSSAATTDIIGIASIAKTQATSFTAAVVADYLADTIVKGTGSTIINGYGVFVAAQTVATNNYGLYIANASPGFAIYVAAGNSRFEGQVGIQQGGINTIALLGIGGNVNFAGAGGVAEGITVTITGSSSATTDIIGIATTASTQATSFTCGSLIGVLVNTNVKGSGSTVTTNYGLFIDTQSAGTTNWDLWINGGNVRMGAGVANGSVATAMSSLGPAGSHSTIQEWLKITTQNGARWIPCF